MREHVYRRAPARCRTGAKATRIMMAAVLSLLVAGAAIGCGDKDGKGGKGKKSKPNAPTTGKAPDTSGGNTDKTDKADKAAAAALQAREAAARGYLARLGHSVLLYMAEHDKPPSSLVSLVKSGVIKGDALFSPLSIEKMEPGAKPVDPGHYICLPVPTSCPDTLIRLYESPEHYGGEHTIVFTADTKVKKVTKAQLDELIAKTKVWLARQGK